MVMLRHYDVAVKLEIWLGTLDGACNPAMGRQKYHTDPKALEVFCP
jgi:hypothetical protein